MGILKIFKAVVSPIAALGGTKAVIGAAIAAVGMATGQGWLVAIGASMTLAAISNKQFGPKAPESQLSRLSVSLDPTAPRKGVVGTTAFPLDMRYQEASGTNQEYIEYIIALAAHEVASVDEMWFEDKKAWDSTSGVTATYTGYLSDVTVRLVGTSANTINVNGGSIWGSDDRLTGCAYIYFKIKRTGTDNKAESPLANGLPSRVTIRGEGALLYDPRLDSTVTGGSGSHRADDQTTWGSYTAADDTDNPALQLLFFLLGWKINGKLSIGCGVPPSRIDLASFLEAADDCDADIALDGGGTQKRYRSSGTWSDADSRMDVIDTFLASMNGTLRDENGKLALKILKNDLAEYVLDLDDNDVLGEFQWNQTRGLDQTYNAIRGRYIDPSDNALYQPVEYPTVTIDSPDGIERVATLDLLFVEEGRRAQRIAKQVLQRNQYGGTFSANFTAKALGCNVGEVVRLSFEPLGWTNKLFRVISKAVSLDGIIPLTLIEENAAIYAWDAEETALVTVAAPTVYDPLNSPFILGALDAAGSATWAGISGTGGQPTGTDVAGTIAAGGGVDTDQVVTDSIVDNSVSDTGFAFTASGTLLTTSYTNVQSLSVTADGVSPVILQFALAYYWSSDNAKGECALYRDSTALVTLDPVTVNSGENPTMAGYYVDYPSAGTYTYYLKALSNDVNQIGVKNRALINVELKK